MAPFHPAVRDWFLNVFRTPTRAQEMGWPAIARGEWTLIFAPTGSGKTLTAFLWALDRLMFAPRPEKDRRCRVVYISPLKALAVDVERNLRAPLAGIANLASERGEPFVLPSIAIRTGDTPQGERARFIRDPADILITTPESIYLMLTSNARDVLRGVETIIIDEVHALVPNKRGAHLALSLERLQRIAEKTPQRIGLSATQNPLEEVAKYLGGFGSSGVGRRVSGVGEVAAEDANRLSLHGEQQDRINSDPRPPKTDPRNVTIINTGEKKQLTLHVEVPVEEMAKLNESSRDDIPSGPAGKGVRTSIWPAIHPRLLELIRAHRSTLIFVNSRRLAERLAGALNELAGELLVQAHHGSIARAQRIEIEDNLKSGRLPALVATSSLELGIDMGAIDLVIQIEAPPSIASGMQRIGRASHQVGTVSEGIIFPKFRGDLLACAAVTDAMHRGAIEPTRYPRNPLDVLAQQLVAMIAVDSYHADELFALVRQAAPFSELSRTSFDGVLDMLSGLYPSDEFAELRPRITWDRVTNILTPRPNAKRVAITSGGTIPDRGLFGVFLAGGEKVQSARVGELDEEMVFESRVGETFLLGASTWRIEEITHDRVLVTPAPGEPGKMPFWKADAAERTVPFGEAIGALVREIGLMQPAAAIKRLTSKHDLGELAAKNFIQYLDDQHAATGAVPDDRTIVIERVLDDLGDWRVCVLTPFGGRIHAPWAMAVTAKVRNELQIDVETMWSDDGFIVRFPDTDAPPRAELLIPDTDEVEQLVVRQLGSSSMFAAKFREAAARALLLPRFRPDRRQPLWQQRKRAYDLLQVASRFGSFPIILETYREVLRDVFDVPALVATMKKIQQRTIRVVVADTEKPSPFAGSLLFRYVANFIYDGDAPLAERRAQALAIDQAQLRELLGEPELRELLDADALHALEIELQHLDDRHKAKSLDALHDLLLRLGDLSFDEIAARSLPSVAPADSGAAPDLESQVKAAIRELLNARRVIEIGVAREKRFIAIEDSSRYRDALGAPLPPGLADRYLQPVADPTGDLVLRYARTHGPFTPSDVAHRYGLGVAVVHSALERFVERGRLIEGEFRPGGTQREWCDNDVLSAIRRRSLAKLRKEVEPVETKAYVRLINHWQFVTKKRRGLEGLLEVIEALQGVALPASIFESEILSARIDGYKPSDLDTLSAAGEIVWTGVEPLGDRDGRIALYLTDHLPLLHSPGETAPSEVEQKIVEHLRAGGASFFAEIQTALGGFANDVVDALWNLVWRGVITNDTFHALRAYTRPKASPRSAGFRSRRVAPPSTQGRWSLVQPPRGSATARASATAHQLLARYGIVVRESAAVEGILGGFSAIYPVLKGMEESGRTRRGYFVAGFGATQFGSAGALDLLRSYRDEPDEPETVMLAATDPANPYGSLLKWPAVGLMRVPGASVILVNGMLGAYVGRGEKQLSAFLPENEPVRGIVAREIAKTLASLVTNGTRRALLIAEVNDAPAAKSDLGPYLAEAGFVPTAMGYQMRAIR
jgi:ATP-dependent Lhr-like helicase